MIFQQTIRHKKHSLFLLSYLVVAKNPSQFLFYCTIGNQKNRSSSNNNIQMASGLRCLSAVATGFAPEDPCEERRNMTTTTTIWTVCNSCHGEGVLRRKRRHSTAPCQFCGGSGLRPSSSSSSLSAETTTTTTTTTAAMSNQEEKGIAPTLRIAICGGGLAGLALAAFTT